MSNLFTKARATKLDRNSQYPAWKETAHRYHEGEPCRYPADMIRVKLARDPDCRREDTRVDIVNYLAMLDELDRQEQSDHPLRRVELPWYLAPGAFETGPETIDRLKRERNAGMGAEFE